MNPLPPQAYTKDILLKAYSWLMSQNNSIKEMATTPDILVSLYLKATRDGNGALDRPSITNFKNELKNLAGIMGELDKAPSIPSTIPMPSIQESVTPVAPTSAPPHVFATPPPTPNISTGIFHSMSSEASHSAHSLPSILQLDEQCLAMIQEVKEELNLSSDAEALRMIIKVGYTRAKSLVK